MHYTHIWSYDHALYQEPGPYAWLAKARASHHTGDYWNFIAEAEPHKCWEVVLGGSPGSIPIYGHMTMDYTHIWSYDPPPMGGSPGVVHERVRALQSS